MLRALARRGAESLSQRGISHQLVQPRGQLVHAVLGTSRPSNPCSMTVGMPPTRRRDATLLGRRRLDQHAAHGLRPRRERKYRAAHHPRRQLFLRHPGRASICGCSMPLRAAARAGDGRSIPVSMTDTSAHTRERADQRVHPLALEWESGGQNQGSSGAGVKSMRETQGKKLRTHCPARRSTKFSTAPRTAAARHPPGAERTSPPDASAAGAPFSIAPNPRRAKLSGSPYCPFTSHTKCAVEQARHPPGQTAALERIIRSNDERDGLADRAPAPGVIT